MKLAQALNERKELNERMKRLKQRLCANVKVQDGDTPSEDPLQLISQLQEVSQELETLICRINRTNHETQIEGVSLSDWITKRDMAVSYFKMMQEALNEAAARADRYSKSEICIKATIDVAQHQQQLDELAKHIRELDAKIQECNWTSELL